MKSRECGRAGHAGGCDAIGRSCPKRVRREQGARQIPRRDSDHSRKANRVQGPSGSFNARWRRELPGGDTEEPEADDFRGSADKSRPRTAQRREGHQALARKRQQRRSRIGKAQSGWVRERFCILFPEISPAVGLETMPGREPRTCRVSQDAQRPANVTAVVKDRNNRARSVAAGVVSGAGESAGVSKAAL
jgi:hypothetical protein